jgi:hypothetical protein
MIIYHLTSSNLLYLESLFLGGAFYFFNMCVCVCVCVKRREILKGCFF